MRTSRDESAVSIQGSCSGGLGDGRGSAGKIRSTPAAVRWAWRLIDFRSLTPAGFRPEEDSRSRGSLAGVRFAAGSTVVDSNERAVAECKVQSLSASMKTNNHE